MSQRRIGLALGMLACVLAGCGSTATSIETQATATSAPTPILATTQPTTQAIVPSDIPTSAPIATAASTDSSLAAEPTAHVGEASTPPATPKTSVVTRALPMPTTVPQATQASNIITLRGQITALDSAHMTFNIDSQQLVWTDQTQVFVLNKLMPLSLLSVGRTVGVQLHVNAQGQRVAERITLQPTIIRKPGPPAP